MGNIVAQNASTNVVCGPFVNIYGSTIADLAIANNQIVLVKEDGTSAARSDAVSATSVGPGLQQINLNATDTNTRGTLTIWVSASAMMPYAKQIEVWNSVTWNAFYGADPILGSAAMSVLIQGAMTNYDVASSADISAIVTVVVKNVFTNMDVATSTGVSALVSVVASAVAGRALTNYDVASSADVSAIVAAVAPGGGVSSAAISGIVIQALTDYDVPSSSDISVIGSAVAHNALLQYDVLYVDVASTMINNITTQVLTAYDVPTSADISAIIPNAVWNKLGSEPTTAPVWDSVTRGSAFDWLLARSLNRHSQTTSTIEMYASAGGVIASASVSNNSVSATRDQFRG